MKNLKHHTRLLPLSTRKIIVRACGLAMVVIGTVAMLKGTSSPKSAALATREQAMEALGACIAKLSPQCKVLVLSNPFAKASGYLDEKSQYERAGLRGLRKGLGLHIPVTVVFPEIRAEFLADRQSVILPPDCRTPLSFVIQPASVDQLAEAHPECRVIVSLIGLPSGVAELRIWSDKDPRCFALLLPDLRVLGPPAKAVAGFQRGKLLAAVALDDKSGDPLIVKRDNIEAVLESQPKAIGYLN
jgi:hypothetical protein